MGEGAHRGHRQDSTGGGGHPHPSRGEGHPHHPGHSLGRQIRAAPGFQLFLPQRESVMKELAKLVRTVTITSLRQEKIDFDQDKVPQAGQCEESGELVYEGAGPPNNPTRQQRFSSRML